MPPHPKVALVLLRCTARATAEVCHCQCHRRRHLLSAGAAAADATVNTATTNEAAMSALPISHGRSSILVVIALILSANDGFPAPLILPKKKDLVYALGKVDTAVPAHPDVTKLLLLLHLPLPQSSVGVVCVIIDPAPLVASLRRLRHCR